MSAIIEKPRTNAMGKKSDLSKEERHARRLAWQRAHRLKTGNAQTKTYEKTMPGFLMRAYRNMQSRVAGIQGKRHLYEGKSLLSREAFTLWAFDSRAFHTLFQAWVASGYDRKLSPSPDRLNSEVGYELGNLEWVTHSVNSRRGAVSRWSKA